MKNSIYLKQKEMVTIKINYHSPELLEMIGDGKEFKSLLFNNRGAFVILEKERDD